MLLAGMRDFRRTVLLKSLAVLHPLAEGCVWGGGLPGKSSRAAKSLQNEKGPTSPLQPHSYNTHTGTRRAPPSLL